MPSIVSGLTNPVLEYDHQDGADVIDWFVYRGTLLPELYGKYVFADHQGPRDTAEPIPNVARIFYGDLTTGNIFQFNVSGLGSALPTRIFSIGQDSFGELYVLELNGVFAIGPVSPGDSNHDDVVDTADYVVWRETLGDTANYNLWRSNYGNTYSAASGQALIPEPASLGLLACFAAGSVGSRWRRRIPR